MPNILVVDDNAELRALIARMLVRVGHSVATAEDGRAALEALRREPFALVVTDIVMPDMEGLTLIRSIRKELPDAKVIAMSGGGRGNADDYLSLAAQFGAVATLQKPFSMDTLIQTVNGAL